MLDKENYQFFFNPEMIQFLDQLPYDACRDTLYSAEDIFEGYDPATPESIQQSFSFRIFSHIQKKRTGIGKMKEDWAQSCHDLCMANALNKMLSEYHPRKVVGIFGGHELPRNDNFYHKVVFFAKRITEMGWLVATGGGPGAMEAGHLGAWLAGRTQEEAEEAIRILSAADHYTDSGWLETEYEVYKKFPRQSGFRSLAIPTWQFGREPPVVFATDAANFFSNAIREDTLLTVSYGGILFLPGSAGTFRVIFQKIVHNHYLVWQYPSPMIFVGKEYWNSRVPFYPAVQAMLKTGRFKNILSALIDDLDSLVDIISDFENIYPLIRAKQQKNTHAILEMLSRSGDSAQNSMTP